MLHRRHTIVVTIVIITITIVGIVTVIPGTSSTSTRTTTRFSTTTSHTAIQGNYGYTTTTERTQLLTTTTTKSSDKSSWTSSGTSSTTSGSIAPAPLDQSYVTKSAPDSSQWLILKDSTSPSQIYANNTGVIPKYTTLASLNGTVIGERCTSTSNDICTSWKYLSETGWYFDSVNLLLYIHYVGGEAVEITVSE